MSKEHYNQVAEDFHFFFSSPFHFLKQELKGSKDKNCVELELVHSGEGET